MLGIDFIEIYLSYRELWMQRFELTKQKIRMQRFEIMAMELKGNAPIFF